MHELSYSKILYIAGEKFLNKWCRNMYFNIHTMLIKSMVKSCMYSLVPPTYKHLKVHSYAAGDNCIKVSAS